MFWSMTSLLVVGGGANSTIGEPAKHQLYCRSRTTGGERLGRSMKPREGRVRYRLLHVLYVACCDVFGWVGVSGYVALGAVAETSFQFVCVGAGGFCQTESEGVTEVVGP